MIKRYFYTLFFLIFSIFQFQITAVEPSSSEDNICIYHDLYEYSPEVQAIEGCQMLLSDDTVWELYNKNNPNPFHLGDKIILFINEEDYVILKDPNSDDKFEDFYFIGLQQGEARTFKVNMLTYKSRAIGLTDGSEWNIIPIDAEKIKNWKIDDRVCIMPTGDGRKYQILNADLKDRHPGIDYSLVGTLYSGL